MRALAGVRSRGLLRRCPELRNSQKDDQNSGSGGSRSKATFEHLVHKDEVKNFLPQLIGAIVSTLLLAGFMRVIDNVLKPSPLDRRINSLTRAMEKNPESTAAVFRLGLAYLHKAVSHSDAVHKDSLNMAISLLSSAHGKDPLAPHVAAALAEAYLIASRPSDALAAVGPIVQRFAAEPGRLYHRSTALCVLRYLAASTAQRSGESSAMSPQDAFLAIPGIPSAVSADGAGAAVGVEFSPTTVAQASNSSVRNPSPGPAAPTAPLPTDPSWNAISGPGRQHGFVTAAALIAVQAARETAASGRSVRGVLDFLDTAVCPLRGVSVPLYRETRGAVDSSTGTAMAGFAMDTVSSSFPEPAADGVVMFGDSSTPSGYRGGLDMGGSSPQIGGTAAPAPSGKTSDKQRAVLDERGFGPYLDKSVDAAKVATLATALCHTTVADLRTILGETPSERLGAARGAAAAAGANGLASYVDARMSGLNPVW